MRCERGQAAVEWVALVALVAVAAAAAVAVVGPVDGRTLGGALAQRIVCAVKRDCGGEERALRRAYGERDAELLRRHAPGLVFEPGERQLPVDWRRCREAACAEAPDDPDLDTHRSATGARATAFTRVVRRGGRRYLQYWLYYPDSNTSWAGSDRLWRVPGVSRIGEVVTGSREYPGFHRDDWEAAVVRVEPDGSAAIRVTSHGHWQWCKRAACAGEWGPATGWVRVSRGSHANHVPAGERAPAPGRRWRPAPAREQVPELPGVDLRERTTTPDAIRLIPLETLDRRGYRRLDPGISPPWEKDAYRNPEADGS
ncbi:MAG: hypothetical protein GXY03_13230 [Solirubrobacterales bacterium]|nr:hypothetical protein [Solirubrobacterales bacterium]